MQLIFQLRLLGIVAVTSHGATTAVNLIDVGFCCAGWLCLTWSIYLVNGISDRVGDRINGSVRPIARGALGSRTALRISVLLATLGLSFCLASSVLVAAAAVVMLSLGFLYSAGPRPLSKSVCGVQVAVVGGGAATYLAGFLASGIELTTGAVTFALALSAWMAVGGLSKDFSDIAGDRIAGRWTLPMWSESGAGRVICALAFAIGASLTSVAAQLAPHLTVSGTVLCIGSIAIVHSLMSRSRRQRDPRAAYRTFMLAQYCAHASAIALVF